jgi:uncharacterized membrane protein
MENYMLENQKELLAHGFSQAQAYTNLILVAGYAGFFAMWSQVGEDLTKVSRFWSGLLIAISLSGFILWEIYGMIVRSRAMLEIGRAVAEPERYEQLIKEQRLKQRDRVIKIGRVWIMVLSFIALTGFGSIAIMISAFVRGLWLHYVGL